jgi:predicted transcriptional regulator
MSQTVLEMTKDLVFAQIHAHKLSPEDMHETLRNIHDCLLHLNTQEASFWQEPIETPERPPAPSNWRKSITKQTVTCLACGVRFKQLSVRHLRAHGLDTRSYRVKFGIPRRQPLSARSVTTRRKQIVQQSRPWEKAPTYLKAHPQVAQPAVKKPRLRKKAHESETAIVVGPLKRVSRKRRHSTGEDHG